MQNHAEKPASYTELWAKKNLARLYTAFRAVLEKGEAALSVELAEKIEGEVALPETIHMLDIGAGGGESTLRIVKKLAEKHKVIYQGIDVSEEQRTSFRLRASGLPENVDINSYEITSWEDFSPQQYDLIVAYHSWYGITGDDSIRKIKTSLTDNGAAYILLSLNKNLAMLAMKDNGEVTYGADEFMSDLRRLEVPFEETEFSDENLNRAAFIQDGKLTHTGKDYLGYLYRRPIDAELEKKILPWLQSLPDEAFTAPGSIIKITKGQTE